MRTLVWFRGKDLRLADHAPLQSALAGGEVVPLFVLDPYFFAPQRAAELPHRMQFLLEALASLAAEIRELGSELVLAEGRSVDVVPELARRLRVDRVAAQRWCEPFARERDRRVAQALHVPFELFSGETLHELGTLRTAQGAPFRLFTPFARAFAEQVQIGEPLPRPKWLPALPAEVRSKTKLPELSALGLSKNPELLRGGVAAARARLLTFLAGVGRRYHLARDHLAIQGTSRLSVDLKFGVLSPRSVWRHAERALSGAPEALAAFQRELLWREFAQALLWEWPELLAAPFREEFRGFPWRDDPAAFSAWAEGRTGYPVVDASARQLLTEGFIPNRARMIAASFLTKHLGVHYALGEAHYLKYLTDGDWASNNLGWQWSAGTGCDAQLYFRVFNPVLQGQKFDPEGDYVRRFVPELRGLPAELIHTPWKAAHANGPLELGSYPKPVIEVSFGRQRYLSRAQAYFAAQRRGGRGPGSG